MESSMTDFGADIASYGRSGDRKLLGLVGMVSSLAVAVGFYAAVGVAQPQAMAASQAHGAYSIDRMATGIESADGPGGAAYLARSHTPASFHGEG
jgi:hypothetical protein